MLLRLVHRWHRRLGIVSASFVLLLVITGLILNHTEALRLDRNYVQNSVFLNLYNINPRHEPTGLKVHEMWINQVGERLYINDREIRKNVTELIGAIESEDELIIAFDSELLVVNRDGAIIESLRDAQGVPPGMRAIGKTGNDDIVVRASYGDYIVDLDTTDWHEAKYDNVKWSVLGILPEDLKISLLKQYRGKGLSVERVLLDLHSGRLFGPYGVYIIDTAAVLFFILALTGVWMWMSRIK